MMTLNAAAAAQGAVAVNSTAMPISQRGITSLKAEKPFQLLLKTGFLFLLGLLLFVSTANAQDSDTLSASDFNLRVTTSGGFIGAGLPTTLQIELGDNENLVNNAVELSIALKLDAGVIFPTNPNVSTGSSWFFDPVNPALTVVADSNTQSITISGLSSTALSGDGNIFNVVVFAGPDGIEADQIINSKGGIVIVEDIGFKKPRLTAQYETRLFPNPFHDRLSFTWGPTVPKAVQVINPQGAIVAQLTTSQIQNGRWAATDLQPGLYHIKVVYPKATETYRVIKN